MVTIICLKRVDIMAISGSYNTDNLLELYNKLTKKNLKEISLGF